MNLKWNAQVFVAFEETVYSHSVVEKSKATGAEMLSE